MNPAIGRIVHYSLTMKDCEDINRRRMDYTKMLVEAAGTQAHVGNPVRFGDTVAVLITRVWPGNLINGQAILDGNDSLWLKSIDLDPNADEENGSRTQGTWIWPPRV